MKRLLFCVFCAFCMTTTVMAQDSDTFQFVDQSGNMVANGSTVTLSDLKEDLFLGNYISSGLSVKNTSATTARVRMVYDITTLDNGTFQICFPVNCMSRFETGAYTTTADNMSGGEQRDLQCEWFPTAYGVCKAQLSLEIMNAFNQKTADGPAVTLVFNYADPTDINVNVNINPAVANVYNLQGQSTSTSTGLRIVRLTNGKTLKLFTK